jgi:hypothetical protein
MEQLKLETVNTLEDIIMYQKFVVSEMKKNISDKQVLDFAEDILRILEFCDKFKVNKNN